MAEFGATAELPRHRLPLPHLDTLAGGRFDPDAIQMLQAAERSRRLLLLRAMVDYARARSDATGPLLPIDAAWDLLLRAEAEAPDIVAELLADPQTGTVIAHTLRRLRSVTDDPAPLWFYVGQLYALATAAAIRAGITGELTVPAWMGDILFPSLGCLRLPVDETWSYATVTIDTVVRVSCHGTTVELDTTSDRWLPVPTLKSTVDGQELVLRLDDQSTCRRLDSPVRPAPLDRACMQRWRILADEAWGLLVSDHPDHAHALAAGMRSLTPIPAVFRFRPHSTSMEDGFGGAILSEPFDGAQLAVTMIHEYQHSILNGIRHLTELVDGQLPATGYAPWRNDPRPLGALIHGIFAFTAVAEFWATHRNRLTGADADLADFEFALWRDQSTAVLRAIRHDPGLTRAGSRVLVGLAARLDRLNTLPVADRTRTLAAAAVDDHRTGWRACHLSPDPDQVRSLADAWTAGRPATSTALRPKPTVLAGKPQLLDTKAALMRLRIADGEQFDRLRTQPALVAGATAADVAYVAGDLSSAHEGYLSELATTPERAGAWSGLGLTLAASGRHEVAQVLLRAPELVRAVASTLAADGGRRPRPDDLAAWLAAGSA